MIFTCYILIFYTNFPKPRASVRTVKPFCMLVIQSLVQLISEFRVKHIDILGNEDSKSKHTFLFKKITSGEITNDEEAAQLLFNKKANSEIYRRFKSDFKEKLLNHLFFLDNQHHSLHSYQRAVLMVQKRWGAITILYQRGHILAATQLAERLLPMAIQYELTEAVVSILTQLKTFYGTQSGDLKKYQLYKELHQQYFELLCLEMQAKDMYENVRINYARSEAYQPELAAQATRDYETLLPALSKKHSAELHFLASILKIAAHIASHDYENVLQVCQEALVYFSKKPFDYRKGISIVLDIKLGACIQLKKYEEGTLAGKQALEINQPSSTNWYLTIGNHIVLSLHCEKYTEAFEYFLLASSQKEFYTVSEKIKERFKLYEAYLFLLASLGKLEQVTLADFPKKGKFRLNKFLNEIPIFQKDKSGMNVPVLILQILYLTQEQNFDKAIDKIKAIELYCHRHLHKHNTLYRANCFIQALIELPKAGFHRYAFIRKAEKYIKKLQELPMEKARQSYIVEIIPFETLWEFVIESLPPAR